MRLHPYLLSVAALPLAVAKQVNYFESNDCADPSGFESCFEDGDSWYADCINENCEGLGVDCHNACECARQSAYVRCAVGHCWNKIYSCEYQMLASDSVTSCLNPDLNGVPFWPAPDDANGRCSCPIGKVTTAQVLSLQLTDQCGDVGSMGSNADEIMAFGMACLCCSISGYLSSLPNFCPRLDPAEIGMEGLEDLMIEYMPNPDWTQCDQWMSGYDCAADFGAPADIQTFYGPGEIPAGSETIRNIGALTTPVSETMTFTIGGTLFPITAVSTDASVPTGSSGGSDNSDSDDSGSGSNDSTGDSDSNSNNDAADSSNNSDSSSNDETTSTDPPEDLGVHAVSFSPSLLGCVVAIIGVISIL
ncbi:hypothetical protein BJY04DRAFT_88437 [Aspergillus karnatakaensis]|uniref:uncharacterized protein n=1 Tax=Aspergillus karnatakaensis TaxID=1810916 RepID=UPI003CCD5675